MATKSWLECGFRGKLRDIKISIALLGGLTSVVSLYAYSFQDKRVLLLNKLQHQQQAGGEKHRCFVS